ncbi:hypothetical protein F443_06350 [Plasmopara halstedii]|uniref:RING-type domain-containing protein n=1 Tax=Plasmopara halstedii TaxID=4781 RepID=A0A0P1AN23_PLAHL|nr:hypothetical protein F443_06350 [Plasmopara halstedii]CEG42583.1 hypothetical protein F443_06350 [Plasmopara halstedii]|eukprot:XP_024578952.1 hypothetical protein F443_06350 [Plasmopara halstedii]
MTRAECVAVWKAARDGDDAKLRELLVDTRDALGPNLVNWKHHNHGTTALMVAAESKRGAEVVWQLVSAGADVNAEDDTKLKNTALHYAAMTKCDSGVVDALLASGADAFAINRKGLSPIDLARLYRREAVVASLTDHMKIHSGWLYLRGKVHWKKRWGVVMACNKQRTSRELCLFQNPKDIRPEAVLLVDEASRASPFVSSDNYFWLKREYAFVFDKPVMWQNVRRQKLTRSPICRKTMSLEDVQIRHLVFAADNHYNVKCWQRVLESTNFYDHETGASLYGLQPYDAAHGELYYWPHELVQNVRSSMKRQSEARNFGNTTFYERLRHSLDQAQPQSETEELLADILRGLEESSNAESSRSRVRFQKTVEVYQPDQSPSPSDQEYSYVSESSIEASHTSSSMLSQQNEEIPDLCTMCYTRRRDAVCAPCGHRAGCHACLKTVMRTTHSCPYCRTRVRSIMRVYD